MTNINNNKIYVLYHAHCTDGTGSKYAAWKKFGGNATYIAVNYNQPVPDMEHGSEIYILDFSYPKNVLEALQATNKSVTVLDHHKTAEASLRGVKGCIFDMHRSGCVMAWHHFHPEVPVPDLLLDIMDRDLWLFKRPHSKSIHEALGLLKGKMESWDTIVKSKELYLATVEVGNTLLQRQQMTIESYTKNKIRAIDFKGFKVGITNATELSSEIGNAICLDGNLPVDFAIVYCITKDNTVLLSLRSVGDFDVSEIAKTFGGGGHKNASGAVVSLDVLLFLLNGVYGKVKGWAIQSKPKDSEGPWVFNNVYEDTGEVEFYETEALATKALKSKAFVKLKNKDYKVGSFYQGDE